MAKSEIEIGVRVEGMIHKALAEVAEDLAKKTGVKIGYIEFNWSHKSVMSIEVHSSLERDPTIGGNFPDYKPDS